MHANTFSRLTAILYILPAVAAIPGSVLPKRAASCRAVPGDAKWPSSKDWARLNDTVGGQLIRGEPLAKSCYQGDLDSAKCTALSEEWTGQTIYWKDPVNVMSPYWLNNSCSPFLGPDGACDLGNVASYAINITDASTVAAGIKFARDRNIRLTVKNTGHDVLGRSAGHGSLALWTHNLKEVTFFNYTSEGYSGPAVRAGAGVQVHDVYQAASDHGMRVVGGGCPSVGLAGGWLPGGGHGPLTSAYGLGADNALEFEVVTANGKQLTASPTQNADLYWALSGGGPGNYAIVLSITLRAHLDGPVAGTAFSFVNTDDDQYWSAISAWLKHLLLLDAKYPTLKTAATFTNQGFALDFATFPDKTVAELLVAINPFIQDLQTLNITVSTENTVSTPTFVEHYDHYTTTQYTNAETMGNRLIPRSLVQNNLTLFVDTMRTIATDNPAVFVFVATNVTHENVGNKAGSNAVLPAWRDALLLLNFGMFLPEDASWDVMRSQQATVNDWQDTFKRITPGGGSYLNEATFDNPEWKVDYFGNTYDRLLSIKKKYDPNNLFWTVTAVGSDVWRQDESGRLCRSS